MAHVIIRQDIISKCEPVFARHNDDGYLDQDRLKEALFDCELGSTVEEIHCVMEGRGKDHKNGIPFDTFVLLAMQLTELKALRDGMEDDVRAAFVTLGGSMEGEGSVSTDSVSGVLKEFELDISMKKLVQSDETGRLEFEAFSAMLSEEPDMRMLSGAFKTSTTKENPWAEEPFYYGGSLPAKARKSDGDRSVKKSERAKANLDDNEETDEAKLKKVRKNFNFMNSLHKQYKDKQSWPRSEQSRMRTSKPHTALGHVSAHKRSSTYEGQAGSINPLTSKTI